MFTRVLCHVVFHWFLFLSLGRLVDAQKHTSALEEHSLHQQVLLMRLIVLSLLNILEKLQRSDTQLSSAQQGGGYRNNLSYA